MSEVEKLPQGWVKATVDDLAEFVNGFAFKPAHWESTGTPIIRIQNLTNSEKPFNYTKIDVPDLYEVNNGDLLVSWSATLDAFIWRGDKAWLNQHIFKVVPRPRTFHSRLLFYWMKIAIEEMITTEHLHGSTMKHINRGPFLAHETRLPPSNEQARIFDKLEELFSELDAGVKELKAAQTKLSQYRQSLLKSAVEGSLTQQWRTENSDQVKETGEQLLARILKQRREQWQQKKLAEFAEKGKKPPKNWQDKYPEPMQPETNDLPELPERWVWASVDQLVYESSYGTSVKCDYGTGNTPVLRIPNVVNKKVSVADLKETVEPLDIGLNKQLISGDILVVRTNGSLSLMGQTALVRDIEDGFYFASYLLRLRTPMDTILPEWMDLYFGSKNARVWIENQASSSAGQNNISLSKLSNLHVPLPPLEEQVQLISALANEFDSINRQVEATDFGLKQSEAQRKNVLKTAFSGQLVPQDPNDEPASVLLEKIKQEREALAKIPKPRKPNKSKKEVDIMNTLLEVLTAENDWIDAQDAFRKCGIVDGTSTDRIEEIYSELRKLEKAGKIQIQRRGDFDQLKLITQDVKED